MEEEQKSKKIWFPWMKKGAGFLAKGIKNRIIKKIFGVRRRPMVFLGIAIFLTGVLFFILWIYSLDYTKEQGMEFNISFSAPYAKDLGLDWQEVYTAMLDDLKPTKVRIPVYWNLLEPVKERFKFEGVDWQIEEAQKRGVQVVLVVGRRVPRWPECHEPLWLRGATEEKKQPEIMRLLEVEINHFKKFDNIVMWQVENEPLFNLFGECPKISSEFLQKEIDLVKSLDDRPIMVTDSGELSLWSRSSRVTNVLGTTMYRVVWNPLTGFFRHINPPAFYHSRASWVKKHRNVEKVIISELQAEPWAVKELFIAHVPLRDQYRGFSIEQFEKNVEFAEKTGLGEAYLWGVEWWYWLREVHGDGSYWDYAREVVFVD